MRPPPWKIGELARQTGLSVRTLHWYEQKGLLSPSLRTESGYRLYTAADVARLQQVVSLRQIGLSLEEVGGALRGASPLAVIEMQLTRLDEEIGRRRQLRERLQKVAARLRAAEEVSVADLTRLIEGMTMIEKHYTPEQLQELAERRRQLGDDRIREVEAEWPRLIAAVRAEMERGSDPASEPVQQLARRWSALLREFTGGNPGIAAGARNLMQNEPGMAQQHGLDPAIFAYIGRAQRAGASPADTADTEGGSGGNPAGAPPAKP
jgi:MerR family transcriptional regulator, thiopeptide resistance regulator